MMMLQQLHYLLAPADVLPAYPSSFRMGSTTHALVRGEVFGAACNVLLSQL
jgi:hypothetical protein